MKLYLAWVGGRTIIGEVVNQKEYNIDKPLSMEKAIEVKSLHVPVQIKDALTGQVKEEIREMITPSSLAPLEDGVFDVDVYPELIIELSETGKLGKLYMSFRAAANGLTLAASTPEQMKLKLVR